MSIRKHVIHMETLPLLALRGLVVFPGMLLHFDVGRKKSILALNEAMGGDQTIFLVTQKDIADDDPDQSQLYSVGVVAKIRQVLKLPGDSLRVLVEGDVYKRQVYDRNRDFYTTTSPSMDILISSNLERLLYDLSGGDAAEIRGMMASLAKEGRYQVTEGMREAIQSQFSAGWCDDRQAAEAIAETFRRHGYLLDTHTAVAMHVYREYRRETGDDTPAVIASTANPYKFAASVLAALGDACGEGDEFARLEAVSYTHLPWALCGIPLFERINADGDAFGLLNRRRDAALHSISKG